MTRRRAKGVLGGLDVAQHGTNKALKQIQVEKSYARLVKEANGPTRRKRKR